VIAVCFLSTLTIAQSGYVLAVFKLPFCFEGHFIATIMNVVLNQTFERARFNPRYLLESFTMRQFCFLGLAVLAMTCFSSSLSAQDLDVPLKNQVYVSVERNNDLTGSIVDLADLKVETEFGQVSIPMAKVDGVKMHADAKDNSIIAFKNGDVVTGKVVLEIVKLKTEWGTAHINTEKIQTIMNSKNSRFYSDNSTGRPIWKFSKSGPTAAK